MVETTHYKFDVHVKFTIIWRIYMHSYECFYK